MEKVEAYRCEECKGEGEMSGPMQIIHCYNCNGTGIVWLTEEEANNG